MKKKPIVAEKPYNRCLTCHHRQVRCDGPRTSAMPLERWCEFMRDMKELNGLTNAEIAERSGVSVKRVEHLMALNCEQDIMRETARLIENAIIGSSNQYPCFLAFEEVPPEHEKRLDDAMRELERALDDNKDYRQALDNIHASYNAEMQTIRDEAQKKIDYLLSVVSDLRSDCDDWKAEAKALRSECEDWKNENKRKSKMIDEYITKLIK